MGFKELHARTADGVLVVASVAALSEVQDPQEGDARYVADINQLYVYTGSAWAVSSTGGLAPPGSSTDNAVVRWDGAGGNAIQNSTVTIDDSGNIATSGTVDGRDVSTDGTVQDAHIAATAAHGATGAVVGTTNTQVLTNKTIDADLNTLSNIENADIKAAAAIDASKIADGSVSNTEFQFINTVTSNVQTQLNDKVDDAEKGAALGVATLDAGGKIPAAQLPNSVMDYKGTWAASTNTPTLANGTGSAGDVYVASDAGTVNFGAGNITFAAGDWVVYSGTIWEKSINSNAVASVNGFTGAVVLTAADVGAQASSSKLTSFVASNLDVTTNTLSSTNAGGNILLDPNGGGVVQVVNTRLEIDTGNDIRFYDDDNSHYTNIGSPSTITANRDINWPDASGTLVLEAATQTLTGKTMSGASNTFTNLSLTTAVTGTLPIANGGTGQTTATAAFNSLSPLTTRGDLLTNDGTNDSRLAVGAANRLLKSDGTDPSWSQIDTTAFFSSAVYVESDISVTFNTGAFTGGSAQTVTAKLRKFGTMVMASFPQVQATTNATSATMSTSATPFSAYAPAASVRASIVTINNDTTQTGNVVIASDGSITVEFFPNGATTITSGTANTGYRRFCASWTT